MIEHDEEFDYDNGCDYTEDCQCMNCCQDRAELESHLEDLKEDPEYDDLP